MARIEPGLGTFVGEVESPYQVSSAQLIDYDPSSHSTPKIFDFSGRISLSRYWLIHVPLVVLIPTALIVFFVIGLRQQPWVMALAIVTVVIPSGLLSVSLLMRRARDLGWSPGWGIAAMLVPVIGTLIYLLLSLWPGRSVKNKYGVPNTPLSTPIKILTCAMAVLVFIAPISFALLFPELYEYLPNYRTEIQP